MNINFTLFAQAATFAIFIWFTAKFVWPHLARAIEARQKQIAEGLAAAERGRQDLEQAALRTAEMLKEAREGARAVRAQHGERGAQSVEDHRAVARGQGARYLSAARREI